MRMPAIIRQIRALLTGYFWASCPVCGHWFAGYECGPGLATSVGGGLSTCSRPACVADVSAENAALFRSAAWRDELA